MKPEVQHQSQRRQQATEDRQRRRLLVSLLVLGAVLLISTPSYLTLRVVALQLWALLSAVFLVSRWLLLGLLLACGAEVSRAVVLPQLLESGPKAEVGSLWVDLAVSLGGMLLFSAIGRTLRKRDRSWGLRRRGDKLASRRLRDGITRRRPEQEDAVGRAPFAEFRLMIHALQQSMALHSCAVYVVHRDGGLDLLSGVSLSHGKLVDQLPAGCGPPGAALSGGTTLTQRLQQRGLPYYEEELRLSHFVGVPIFEGARPLGVLCADRLEDEPWSEAEKTALESAAEAIQAALRTEKMIDHLEASDQRQTILYEAAQRFASATGEQEVVDAGFDAARAITYFDFAAVTRLDGDAGAQRVVQAVGTDAEYWRGKSVFSKASLITMALQQRCVLPLRGTFDPGQQVVFEGVRNLPRMRFVWVFPLVCRDSSLGTLVLARKTPWPSAESTKSSLELLTSQLSMALANADLVSRLEALATIDELTGCRNKRSFQIELAARLHASERFDRPLALVVCDIDHFKKVNDTYGHAAGDEVLRAFGALLQREKRQTDIVGRFGGEEFCLLCEETDLHGATLLAERIRSELEKASIRTKQGELQVTCSIGIACTPLHLAEGKTLFELADEALYRAKNEGRNRVVSAGPEAETKAGGLLQIQ